MTFPRVFPSTHNLKTLFLFFTDNGDNTVVLHRHQNPKILTHHKHVNVATLREGCVTMHMHCIIMCS